MELALAKPQLRAEFELDLKLICQGQKDPKVVLTEQIAKYKQAYQQITDKITAMDAKISARINETPAANSAVQEGADGSAPSHGIIQSIFQCPKCNEAPLALKPKKNQQGWYIGCNNFPDCKNAVWLPTECKDASVLDECCPTCGDGYRMLKFRLSTPYYRGVFGTPSGWYKTCLPCDNLFRTTFNINLDSVKKVGGIVGEVRGGGGGPGPGPGGGGSGRGAGSGGWSSGPGGGGSGGGGGLYTKGFISYPRTETNQFSKEFALAPLVEMQTGHRDWGAFAQRVIEWGPNPRNGNKSDQAHPPIHPTKLAESKGIFILI